jgi:hypothetical protein
MNSHQTIDIEHPGAQDVQVPTILFHDEDDIRAKGDFAPASSWD